MKAQTKIPEDWKLVRLRDIADYINGYPFSPKDWKKEGLPIIRIQNLNDPNAEFNYFNGRIEDRYIIKNGDILLSWSASIGVYIWKGDNAVLNQHIFKVVPKSFMDKLFLYYSLFLAIEQLKKRVHGSTMKHFKRKELNRTFIPLPPLPEQKAIAKILSTVDKAIQKVDEIIAKTERLKKGLMQELLTKGIGHNEFKKVGITFREYHIPIEWQVKNMLETSTIKGRIGWHGLKAEEYLENGEYYLVRGTEFENGKIAWEKCVYISKERYERDPYIQLKEEDVLVTKDGSIGKIAFVNVLPKKATLGTGVFVIRPVGNAYLPKYMFYVMQSEFFENFINVLKAGSTLSHLYQKDFIKFKFPLPPLPEQQKIAEILSTIDKKLELERKRKEKLERIKKGLMNDLLTGRKRVNVKKVLGEIK